MFNVHCFTYSFISVSISAPWAWPCNRYGPANKLKVQHRPVLVVDMDLISGTVSRPTKLYGLELK